MKINLLLSLGTACVLGFLPTTAHSQFSSGSTGADDALDLPSGNRTLQVPASGIFNFTKITLGQNTKLFFTKNAANTPVYLLSQGDVLIQGEIHMMGSDASPTQAGVGGPGGFDGGSPSLPGETVAGWGAGPGGGKPGSIVADSPTFLGSGSYATKRTLGTANEQANNGLTYGTPLILPMVGGSGGGGGVGGGGGGGGGGALLIASSTNINLSQGGSGYIAHIFAYGGNGSNGGFGSGGAVRLVAPLVILSGSQPRIITARTEQDWTKYTGNGRIRIDTLDASQVLGRTNEFRGSFSIGKNMLIFPPNLPVLEIIEAAGQAVDPKQSTTLALPSGIPTEQPVKVRATNFGGVAKLKVVLTPERGAQTSYELDIANPGPDPAIGTATVTFPGSALTRIDVWTR